MGSVDAGSLSDIGRKGIPKGLCRSVVAARGDFLDGQGCFEEKSPGFCEPQGGDPFQHGAAEDLAEAQFQKTSRDVLSDGIGLGD